MLQLKVVEAKEKITNDWTIERVASEYPPASWETVFEDAKNELKDISDIVEANKGNKRLLPDKCDLFRTFNLTPLHKVRVVILGQDPYHNILPDERPQAIGMAFSVPRGATIPSSLKNSFKELKDSVPEFQIPNHGDLTAWALQGVLMLNSSFIVRQNEPGCFKEIWNGFLKKVCKAILDVNPKCIFVAWGKHAQTIAKKFLGSRATVLEAAHPSGLSAHRGFFKCGHFPEINRLLISKNQEPIDWNLFE